MTKKQLCQLFDCHPGKHGQQMAYSCLSKILHGRNWRLSGRQLTLMGFQFSKDKVTFCNPACQTFQITVDEAIDCISGNLDTLLKYQH